MDQDRGIAQPHPADDDALLTIGELGERTGVSPAVLRMWETRHGFPEPRRLPSGHRRYAGSDVALVGEVVQRKEAGMRLEAAIASLSAAAAPPAPSIFAQLRRSHPGLPVHRLRKSTLIALSWAIEDECCAVAETPVLFGAFQRGDFYAPSAARWRELARVARSAIVFADEWPGSSDATVDTEGPVRSVLDPAAPMRREWAVVCDARDSTACLSAWELPGQADVPDRQRLFEAVWTVEASAVRDAARVAARVAAGAGVDGAEVLVRELAAPAAPRPTAPPAVTALFNRVVAYVDRLA